MTTEEASKTEATKSRPAPAYRKPTQTRAGRLRQELIADYIAKLGGKARVSAIVLSDVTRVVDLTLAASHQRAELAAGRAKLADVTKFEGTLARALKRLNLPKPDAAAPVPSLAEYLAGLDANEPEAGGT